MSTIFFFFLSEMWYHYYITVSERSPTGKYLGYTVFRIYGFSLQLLPTMQALTETSKNK